MAALVGTIFVIVKENETKYICQKCGKEHHLFQNALDCLKKDAEDSNAGKRSHDLKIYRRSKESKYKISEHSSRYWKNITDKELEERRIKHTMTRIRNGTLDPNKGKNPYSRTHGGKRKDLNNIYFRSGWEANMARYYNYVGIKWEFEPKTFVFKDIKKGCVSYTPDFYLPEEKRWVEVKGWMTAKSKTKLKRFEKFYPDESARLEIIGEIEYKEFKKYSRLIENWE